MLFYEGVGMTESEILDRLAELAGIEPGWWDFFGKWRVVPAETKKVFLSAMGFSIDTPEGLQASLLEMETRSWRRWMDPIAVFDQTWRDTPSVLITVPARLDLQQILWSLTEEGGRSRSGIIQVNAMEWVEERWVGERLYKRWRFRLPGMPPPGYHRLSMQMEAGCSSMVLAVAPASAYAPPAVSNGRKAWGLATQVYALRSPSDWGIGSYATLKDLVIKATALGAATVGVNPLHALPFGRPDRYSPYFPSSRRLLNTAYIDIEEIPEFRECPEAQRMFASPGFQANLARVRGYPLVDYEQVFQLQRPMLEILYRWFKDTHLAVTDARTKAYQTFCNQGSRPVRLISLFAAICNQFEKEGIFYWREWPEAYRDPSSPAVADFAANHQEQIDYFSWMQFLAHEQLQAVHQAGVEAGAKIGLYLDLAVGIAGDGADAWVGQDVMAVGVSVGAPPDPLAPKGQDWGLVPFDPLALREAAYGPFLDVIRSNMQYAGALRIDHAMALQRLYWVPPGLDADQGAYVRYPVDDLFRLMVLESHRNKCLLIGEDLGTVPEGFRERMDRSGLFAYRVMMFEQKDGCFKAPDAFDEQALSIFATHDLPSIRGYWNEADISARERLHLYPTPESGLAERANRKRERMRLIEALMDEGLLPPGTPSEGILSDEAADRLINAVHLYLARGKSRLMMVQIEDVLGLDTQMNLPGTTVEYPNWKRRFPVGVGEVVEDPRMLALVEGLRKNGRS